MQSTLSGAVPLYIGADLTDRYSPQCREIDVCGLTPAGPPIGAPLPIDSGATLREGPMIIPRLTAAAAARIAGVVPDFPLPEPPASRVIEPAAAPSEGGAQELLAFFIAKAAEGDPHVCTYAWAYRRLCNATYNKFSQAYAQRVIHLACRTHPRELPGLGLVRLDAFTVSKQNGLPSNGYWPVAQHSREDGERALGNATVLD